LDGDPFCRSVTRWLEGAACCQTPLVQRVLGPHPYGQRFPQGWLARSTSPSPRVWRASTCPHLPARRRESVTQKSTQRGGERQRSSTLCRATLGVYLGHGHDQTWTGEGIGYQGDRSGENLAVGEAIRLLPERAPGKTGAGERAIAICLRNRRHVLFSRPIVRPRCEQVHPLPRRADKSNCALGRRKTKETSPCPPFPGGTLRGCVGK
jgi:hypothetical protein